MQLILVLSEAALRLASSKLFCHSQRKTETVDPTVIDGHITPSHSGTAHTTPRAGHRNRTPIQGPLNHLDLVAQAPAIRGNRAPVRLVRRSTISHRTILRRSGLRTTTHQAGRFPVIRVLVICVLVICVLVIHVPVIRVLGMYGAAAMVGVSGTSFSAT